MFRMWKLAGAAILGVAVTATAAKGNERFPIKGRNGEDVGSVTLIKAKKGGVRAKIQLHDMPFGPHGVHFHQNAVCEGPDFKTAGGHFNPDGKQHGFQNPMGHHAGDTPENIQVGEDHRGEVTLDLPALSIDPAAPNSVFGTSLVVHEKADDMTTDPSGNSGNRIACAVIKR